MDEIKKEQHARVRLCTNQEGYKEKFGRFIGDNLNGWIPEKAGLAGQTATVTKTYEDQTITAKFSDGQEFDFPIEAVA